MAGRSTGEADERFVREYWRQVYSFANGSGGWTVKDNPFGDANLEVFGKDEAEAMSKARAFTEQRLREIQQTEEDINCRRLPATT